MKILEKDIKQGGFDLKQVWRDGDVAIYRKSKPTHTTETFEVIRVQRHDGYTIAGATYPPAEHFPSSEQWGTYGWTYPTREAAEKRAFSLLPPQTDNRPGNG